MALKNILGYRFGKLLVVDRAESLPDKTAVWKCVCDCGQERLIAGTGLRAGRHKSCGCSSPKFTKDRTTTHGRSKTRTYLIWLHMKARCSAKAKGKLKKLYFDKGIRVCERWKDFLVFLSDMGEAPPKHSIERIDGNKNYEPSNCKWATSIEQANNTSRNSVISYLGKSLTISMWARELGIKPNTLLYRLRRGIPLERALQPQMPIKAILGTSS